MGILLDNKGVREAPETCLLREHMRRSNKTVNTPAFSQHVEDVVSESISVLLQHPPHIVHHLQPATRGRQSLTGATPGHGQPTVTQMWRSYLSCVVSDSKEVNSNTGFHIKRVFLQKEIKPKEIVNLYNNIIGL